MNPLLNLFIRITGIILFILIETQSDLIGTGSGLERIIWFILMIIASVFVSGYFISMLEEFKKWWKE